MKYWAVGGLKGSGKTSLIQLLIQEQKERNNQGWAGFKPFDTGLIADNAADLDTDGQLISAVMEGLPHATLVNPYHAHESLPLEIALEREGVRVKTDLIQERLGFLLRDYQGVFIESLPHMWSPVSDDLTMLGWLQKLEPELIWVMGTEPEVFEANLAELNSLKSAGISTHILLNNAARIQDQDWLMYMWPKLQQLSGFEAFGMLSWIDQEEGHGFELWKESLNPLFETAFKQE